VGGTDWSATNRWAGYQSVGGLLIGGWHQLEKWVAPIGVIALAIQ
jgi:hypothetical protein